MSTAKSKKVIIAASLGNGLEIFDFTVYSFFAVIIGKLYFPSESETTSWLIALATFGVGFVMRPLGSIVIGNYADKAGRKAALTLTIALMAIGTATIGLAPTYAQIGVLAPILIVMGRMLQGFSAGGEIGAATSFLMESGTVNNRGFMVSWQMASQGAAALIGALFATLLMKLLPEDDLLLWGWRVPFIFGLLIGPVGFYIRRHLDETHSAMNRSQSALSEILKGFKLTVFLGILMIMGATIKNYVMLYFMPSFLIKTLGMPAATSQLTGVAAGFTIMIACPLFGMLTDKFTSRKKYMLVGNLLSIIAVLPAFWVIQQYPDLRVVIPVVVLIVLVMSISSSAGFLLFMEAFPRRARATGLSIIYATGVTLFGGFAQFTVAGLLKIFDNNPMTPAWYMTICSVISYIALMVFNDKKKFND